ATGATRSDTMFKGLGGLGDLGKMMGQMRELQEKMSELQQRIADAEALARELRQQGQDVAPLQRAIDNLRNMTSTFTSLDDKRAEEMLRSQVVEGLKAYEYALRRANGDDASTRVLLERSGDVPPAFKALVEEYYRSLSRPAPKKPEPPPKQP
ncbi:MAG: hypothetical protein U9Q74_14960, partial [Gemmatimonadota bacterium]|nr:hypothetical protein [Gemmatimonadota bacterium]